MRIGASSSSDSRSSTNGVEAGTGCLSWSRIQPLSKGSAAVAWAIADVGASAHSSSAAAAIIPARGFRFAACIVLFPEIVEVEPVVGSIAHMMFQPPGITADERRDGRGALAPGHVDALAEG